MTNAEKRFECIGCGDYADCIDCDLHVNLTENNEASCILNAKVACSDCGLCDGILSCTL